MNRWTTDAAREHHRRNDYRFRERSCRRPHEWVGPVGSDKCDHLARMATISNDPIAELTNSIGAPIEMEALITFPESAVPSAHVIAALNALEQAVYEADTKLFLLLVVESQLSADDYVAALAALAEARGQRCRLTAIEPGSTRFKALVVSAVVAWGVLAGTGKPIDDATKALALIAAYEALVRSKKKEETESRFPPPNHGTGNATINITVRLEELAKWRNHLRVTSGDFVRLSEPIGPIKPLTLLPNAQLRREVEGYFSEAAAGVAPTQVGAADAKSTHSHAASTPEPSKETS
jgi:hypothetical protein